MALDEHHVWTILRQHRGRAGAIKAGQLQVLTGYSDYKVRKIVKALIERHGCLIGSSPHCPAGFWLIVDAPEMQEAKAHLYSRIYSMAIRLSRMDKTSLTEVFGQLALRFQVDQPPTPAPRVTSRSMP